MDKVKLEAKERQPCEVFCRVVGYFRPVKCYNLGKKAEFKERLFLKEKKIKPLVRRCADLPFML